MDNIFEENMSESEVEEQTYQPTSSAPISSYLVEKTAILATTKKILNIYHDYLELISPNLYQDRREQISYS